MAKNIKLNIKNVQIAKAINLEGVKSKIAKKKEEEKGEEPKTTAKAKVTPEAKTPKTEGEELGKPKEEAPRIRARSKSAFAEGAIPESKYQPTAQPAEEVTEEAEKAEPSIAKKAKPPISREKTSEELRKEIFGEEAAAITPSKMASLAEPVETKEIPAEPLSQPSKTIESADLKIQPKAPAAPAQEPPVKLGPTGRHVRDLLPKREPKPVTPSAPEKRPSAAPVEESAESKLKKGKFKGKPGEPGIVEEEPTAAKKGPKAAKVKEYRDIKPTRGKGFDSRDRQGLRGGEEEEGWRKKRPSKFKPQQEEPVVVRPTALKIRVPITIKDLAAEMKLKAAELISKLFLNGLVVTLNDLLEDHTTIQLLGQEFGCEITIDTSEEERIRITDKSIREEVRATNPEDLVIRPPVVAFMGHVDHGKTTLIDSIRKSNRAAGEAGAITQHIGAFRCHTSVGDITVLDTPGHEAFFAMRARGADVTDIVVLVVAGDEGIRQQTLEAIQHAKSANVTIVVAINKCDKPNFNAETVYRQLADQELLPEVWGGQTITVNCSAVTGQGVPQLLEMLALQAEILELKANPKTRARGSVLESEMHKGLGAVATVLVQNGTLHIGDALVFEQHWGRVKTMQDEFGNNLQDAPPSTPVAITGLSALPEAGQEFIVVKNEREAREISEVRISDKRSIVKKKIAIESMMEQAGAPVKKVLNIIIRADVQGSLEALKTALMKIVSQKVECNIIFADVGEVSESDVQRAAASKAIILGFHTQIESHAETLTKELGVQVRMHDIIYHAVDDIKAIMTSLLDKLAQENEKGKAIVKAVFKSSHFGLIAGCQVTEGTITRNNYIRVMREGNMIWKGTIASLKRVKEDVKEVQKGVECGILLNNFNDVREGDILEAYEVIYIAQEL